MHCGAEIDANDEMTIAEGQLIPPVVPNFTPVDLKALAE